MAAPVPSPYSYYASQTVRTLRGILDAGVSATGWSSSSTSTTSATSSWNGSDNDTLRGPASRQDGMPDMQRRTSGAGHKKNSRPSLGNLFDDAHGDTREVDQGDAKVEARGPRHNWHNSDIKQNSSSSSTSKTSINLDRVLIHAGCHPDPYATDSYAAGAKLPLLALCPCNLPSEITDLIVSQLSTALSEYAQRPYMLIIFASPSNPVPVQHLIRYYRALTPEIRRNIARLWICHPGLFTKIAVKLFLNTIVSGKVTRKGKVKLVDSLNALGKELNLSQVQIPPQVLIHDSKVNGKLSLPSSSNNVRPIFGSSLSESMGDNQLPRPVLDATKHLRISPNLQTVGLFRKTPSITLLEVLKNAYESNLQVDLSEWPDNVILAGSLLKTFLRNLRYPLFPSSIYEDIKKCPTDNEDEAVRYIKDILLSKVGQEHPDGELAVKLLEELLRLSKDVALHRDINQMDSHNLAVVFLPVLVRSADIQQDALMCTMPRKMTFDKAIKENVQSKNGQNGTSYSSLGMIIKLCIERFDGIFPSDGQQLGEVESHAMTPESSRSISSASATSTEPKCEQSTSSKQKTLRRHKNDTLKLLGGSSSSSSPGTVKRMNGKVSRSEASRESARGLFARDERSE